MSAGQLDFNHRIDHVTLSDMGESGAEHYPLPRGSNVRHDDHQPRMQVQPGEEGHKIGSVVRNEGELLPNYPIHYLPVLETRHTHMADVMSNKSELVRNLDE